jgi:hypothetical protein
MAGTWKLGSKSESMWYHTSFLLVVTMVLPCDTSHKYQIDHFLVFWVMTPCNDVVRYQHFGLLLHWRWRHHGPPKCWYLATLLHGVITQKSMIGIFIAMKIWSLNHIWLPSDQTAIGTDNCMHCIPYMVS